MLVLCDSGPLLTLPGLGVNPLFLPSLPLSLSRIFLPPRGLCPGALGSLGPLRTLCCPREEPLGGFLEQKLLTGRSLPPLPQGAQSSSAKQPRAEKQQLLLGNPLRKGHQNMARFFRSQFKGCFSPSASHVVTAATTDPKSPTVLTAPSRQTKTILILC